MKNTKIVALSLSALMLLGTFTACGNKEDVNSTTSGENETAASIEAPEKEEHVSFAPLTAQKVGSWSGAHLDVGDGALIYSDNGSYGILSLDGKNDTGAKFTYCTRKENYFVVSENTEFEDMNCFGLADASGKVIIPMKYASFDVLNDRFVKVYETTEETDSKEEALVYSTDRFVSLGVQDGDKLYKGNWYIYDVRTGETVDGATGTKAVYTEAYGNYVSFNDDNGKRTYINSNGKALPAGAEIKDGYDHTGIKKAFYYIEGSGKGEVYDTEDDLLFTYDSKKYNIYGWTGDYIYARADEDDIYVLFDMSGNIVASGFERSPDEYGGFVLSDDILTDLNGKKVVDGTVDYVRYYDYFGRKVWLLKNCDGSDIMKMIDAEGNVLFEGSNDDYTEFYCVFDNNSGGCCYSYKDKDFTVKGASIAPWLAKTEADGDYSALIDVYTGNTVIDGYSTYGTVKVDGVGVYIYARNNDTTDIYFIAM